MQERLSVSEDVDAMPERPARQKVSEYVKFPDGETKEGKPVLLNSNQHVVGYLSRILNARVYDVSQETELQHAKNISMVRVNLFRRINCTTRLASLSL